MRGLIFLSTVLCACGPTRYEKRAVPGFAQTVFQKNSLQEVHGLEISAVRVVSSGANQDSLGSLEAVDDYSVEITFRVKGEDSFFQKALIQGLRRDDDGNLFHPLTPIGLTTSAGASVSERALHEFTRGPLEGLLFYRLPLLLPFRRDMESGSGASELSQEKSFEFNLTELNGAYSGAHAIEVSGSQAKFFSRTRVVEDLAGANRNALCVVKPETAAGESVEASLLWQEIEVGRQVLHRSGRETGTGSGVDDALVADVVEEWYLAGASLKTGEFSFVKKSVMPLWQGLELPGVDDSTTASRPSGFARLLWKCNSVLGAAPNAGGGFRLAATDEQGGFTWLTNDLNYCAGLRNESETGDGAGVRLDRANLGCQWNTGAAVGTWNGTAHTGPVTAEKSFRQGQWSAAASWK